VAVKRLVDLKKRRYVWPEITTEYLYLAANALGCGQVSFCPVIEIQHCQACKLRSDNVGSKLGTYSSQYSFFNVTRWPGLRNANSSWKCNETFFEKYFVRSAIAEGLAGTIV